jgi:2-oxoglutarate dehydrogenase E2 component (dihydrolipoamide succinyltransferase)
MSVEVVIPQLGESITEAVIAVWLKSDGDLVREDEPICELETDKANTEMPSPASGVLRVVQAQGATVHVGEVIARIEPADAAAAEKPKKRKSARAKTKEPARPAPAATPAPAAPAPQAAAPAPSAGASAEESPRMGPAARRLARESGIDPATAVPTGAGNRVTKQDLLRASQSADSAAHLSLVDSSPEPTASSAPTATGTATAATDTADEERVPMTPIRRRIADRLVQAQQTAAILTTFNEVDMSRVMELRARHKDSFAERHGTSLGFMGFFARACIEALEDVPQINARIDEDSIVYNNRVHLGIAASTPRGLVVPVVRNADLLDLPEIEREVARLATLARDNKLAVTDLTGGTFTISNGGVFGSLLSTPILNPPQSGILGMHKIEKRPVVVDDQIVIRPMMYLALSYDHRIVDGREAVTFLVKVKERIEDPERLLLSI